MGAERGLTVHLIESDRRKGVFLREAARVLGLGERAVIHTARIESLEPIAADCVTARALAPVSQLLSYASRAVGPNTPCLFLKGKRLQDELTDIKSAWYIEYRIVPSKSDPDGEVLAVDAFSARPPPEGSF
jgi:16S rRNA (guanine527-N7)-methyltransferase